MKLFLTLSAFLILNSCNLFAQWLPEYRLTNSAGFSVNTAITSNENYIHIVWQETRDGNQEIYYKRSTDDGLSWETDIRLTNTLGISSVPSISISGTFVYVVWSDFLNGNSEIYFKRSSDNGVTWGGDTQLTNNASVSTNPNISASGQFIQLIWRDVSNGFFEIFHKHSSDWGATWSTDSQLTIHTSGVPGSFSISTTGLNVHIAWSDSRDGNNEIYYKRSTDNGETWETDKRLTNNASVSEVPSITSLGTGVHIAWLDLRDGNSEIYYNRSTDGGTTWGADIRLTEGPFVSQNPAIFSSGTILHLVWQYGISNLEILYKRSMDNGLSWVDSTQLSNSFSTARDAAISAYDVSTHVVWTDTRHGSTNHEIYYKQNPTGNISGIENISLDFPEGFMLDQNYPNPFNPSTSIKYQVSSNTQVSLKVYDVLGNEVAILVNEEKPAGSYEVDFNAVGLSSGIYFYKLQSASFVETKKMTLLK
jgi:Secretion system C-terminal sorting domain